MSQTNSEIKDIKETLEILIVKENDLERQYKKGSEYQEKYKEFDDRYDKAIKDLKKFKEEEENRFNISSYDF